ncbi:MAG: hypothetical protein CMJ74_00845 [Planctomycetaceae bacterium]|nr:hypothetical protein [Planctomycetaceae bacterium]
MRPSVEHVSANPLLDEIEALQDQVLSELDQLNKKIETVLKVHLATEAGEIAVIAADSVGSEGASQSDQHAVPAIIHRPYLHLTTFLPARAG